MRRGFVGAAVLGTGLALAGCGGEAPESADAAATSSGADADAYAAQVSDAFRDAYSASGGRGDGDPTDWTAFVRVIEDLAAPAGEEMDHEQMVAGFEAYVGTLEDLADVCAESPGPGGPCFTAARAAGDQWKAALDRAYEVSGLSYNSLLG